jgi:hypothetical protein
VWLCNTLSAVDPHSAAVHSIAQTFREVVRPSGDITSRVRSTRDYHPRHLPPMSFLNPSTDSSSAWLACRISYRHHLWDSKLKEQGDSSSVFDSRV